MFSLACVLCVFCINFDRKCDLLGKKDSYQTEKFMRGCRFLEAELQDMDRVLSGRCVLSLKSVFLLISIRVMPGTLIE